MLIGVLLGLVVLAACSATGGPEHVSTLQTTQTSGGVNAATGEDLRKARESNDGSLPLDVALDLFASIYGEIPGATARFQDVRRGDGSLAIRTIGANWEALDDAQRAAVGQLVTSDSATGGRSELVVMDQSAGGAPRAIPHVTTNQQIEVPREAMDYSAQEEAQILKEAADELAEEIADRLGTPLTADLDVRIVPSNTFRGAAAGDAAPMSNGSLDFIGPHDTCQIRIGEDETTPATTIAHEVFHCFQFEMATLNIALSAQDWIIEGSAEWAAATLRLPDEITRSFFDEWVATTDSLFVTDYEAVGYFWTVESLGQNPWSIVEGMINKRGAAAVDASGVDRGIVAERMATGLARRSIDNLAVDEVWDLSPRRVPDIAGRTPADVSPQSPFQATSPANGWFSHSAVVVLDLEGASIELDLHASVGALQLVGEDLIRFKKTLSHRICLPEGGGHQMLLVGARVEPGEIMFDVQSNNTAGAAIDCWVDDLNASGQLVTPLSFVGDCPEPTSVEYDSATLCFDPESKPDLADLPWSRTAPGDEFYAFTSVGDIHHVGYLRMETDSGMRWVAEACLAPSNLESQDYDCEPRQG